MTTIPSRNVRVVLTFPDAEAKQASRLTSVNVVTVLGPNEIDDETQAVVECAINTQPTVVERRTADVVCEYCGDYLHQPSDAYPDDDRWFDTSGDDECYRNFGAGTLAPDQPGPHKPIKSAVGERSDAGR